MPKDRDDYRRSRSRSRSPRRSSKHHSHEARDRYSRSRSYSRSPVRCARRGSRSGSRERRRERSRDRDEHRPRDERDRSRSRSRSPVNKRRRYSYSPSRSRSRSRDRDSRKDRKRRRERSESVSSSSSSESERRRKKKRKEGKRSKSKERERKERKERKREKKERKEKKKKASSHSSQWGKYGIISEIDIYNKGPEFHTWLVEERKINPETISKDQNKKEFARFVEDFNTATLPHEKYYNMAAYERRMSALRSGEFLPPTDDAYDPSADMKALSNAHKKKPTEATSYLSKEQLMELRKVQNERVEAGKMKLLGMDIKQNMGVRMDGTMFDD